MQMIEQRCVTPAILTVRNRGGNPLVLCAMGYMMAVSLPSMLGRMVQKVAGLEDVASSAADAADGATADAGDEAHTAEGRSANAGSEAANPEEEEEEEVGFSAETVATAGTKVSRLLARGLAAKEADGKAIARPAARVAQDAHNAPAGRPDNKPDVAEGSRKAAAQQTGEAAQDDGGGADDGGDE